MQGFARQALPGCGVDQFQAARWISFRPPASKIFALDGPSDYSFANGFDRSEWLVETPPCRKCGQGGKFRDARPLLLEWEPGSVRVGDFTWSHRGRLIVRETVGQALVKRYAGLELAKIEMVQDRKLKRPPAAAKRVTPRLWLPWEGEELVELVVGPWIEPDERSTLKRKGKCKVCGRDLVELIGTEERELEFDATLGRPRPVTVKRRRPHKGIFVSSKLVKATPIFRSDFASAYCSEEAKTFIEQFSNVLFVEMGETTE